MKKFIIALTAAALLTGCSSNETSVNEADISENISASETTAAVTSSTTLTSELTSTTISSATESQTTEPQTTEHDYEYLSGKKVPVEESAALKKLNEKYGKEFEVVSRNVCWESWGEEVIDEDGTVHFENSELDPSEPLSVYYNLRDSDGSEFGAYIKENTDIITYDSYLYVIHKEQFEQEIGEVMNRLLPGGKVNIENVKKVELPFECSADMSYEEFRQAFIDNGGKLSLNVFVTDGIEVPEEMKNYRTESYLEELGCPCRICVYKSPQEYYDSLENICTGHLINIDGTIING